MPDSFQLILIGVLLVLTVALGFGFFMLFRWKVAFDGKEIVAFPSNQLDDLYASLSALGGSVEKSSKLVDRTSKDSSDDHSKVFERVQALLKAVSDTRSEYRTLRDDLESKSNELERFKEGYDLRIIRKSIQPVLANHVLITQELERDELSDDHRKFAELIEDGFGDLLHDCEIRTESPAIGSSIRDNVGVSLPPETIPAASDDQVGTIASVKSPCYVMNYEGSDVVVKESQVVVYAETLSEQES